MGLNRCTWLATLLLVCLVSLAFLVLGCPLLPLDAMDDPADPYSPNYQGYDVVGDPSQMTAYIENGAVLVEPVFTVSKVVGAQAYWLQVATDEDFTDIVFSDDSFTGNVIEVSSLQASQDDYYWRVAVKVANTWSSWTADRSFTYLPISTVYFDSQGGIGGTVSVIVTYGSAMPVATAPTRTGYVFEGYYEAISGGGTQYYTNTMASSRIWDKAAVTTLYAKWIAFSIPMAFVEGGTFQMGSTSGDPDESPVHNVTLSSYYIGTLEITQDIFEQEMGSNPSNWKGTRLPVERVTWYEAVAFCNAMSLRDGLEEVYTINGTSVTCDWDKRGYRLPTEAEWEYAARGGAKSLGYLYAGSNTIGDVAWYEGNSGYYTHDVGGKIPNELGLYDMSGNVWEWCWDWYGAYGASASTDPRGPSTGSLLSVRGGSWRYVASVLRIANRDNNTPSVRYYGIGFRLVRPLF